jgi:hypothetical protein
MNHDRPCPRTVSKLRNNRFYHIIGFTGKRFSGVEIGQGKMIQGEDP